VASALAVICTNCMSSHTEQAAIAKKEGETLLKATSSPFALVEIPSKRGFVPRNSGGGGTGVYQRALISAGFALAQSDPLPQTPSL